MRGVTFLSLVLLGSLATLKPLEAQTFLGKTQRQWIAQLESAGQPEARRSAAFALGRMGDHAFLAIDPLVGRLKGDAHPAVRAMAASALGDIAQASVAGKRGIWEAAGPALLEALREGEARLKRSAAYALGSLGQAATPAASDLHTALRDGSATVRQNAAWALGQIGPGADESAAELGRLLSDADPLVRRDAAWALGQLSPSTARQSVSPLLDLIQSEKEREGTVVLNALNSLGKLTGPDDRPRASLLYPYLTSRAPDVRRQAALVLGNMGGPPAMRALPILREALSDSDPEVQAMAAAGLGNIGPDAGSAIPDLVRALSEGKHDDLRRNAAIALGHIGNQRSDPSEDVLRLIQDQAVPALVQGLNRSEPRVVRQFCSESLAQIGYPVNKEAIPAILEAIDKDPDQVVRQRCVWSLFNLRELQRYGGDRILGKVIRETGEESLLVRYDAARVLAFVLRDSAPDETPEVLLHMLRNRSLLVFNQTDAKVDSAGGEVSRAGSNVQANLGGDARYMAAQALGWLGARAAVRADIVTALRQATRDPDARLRQEAEKALHLLGK
jgi:HEAT repeat protein